MKLSSALVSAFGILAAASPSLALPIGQAGRAVQPQERDSWTSYWTTRWTVTQAGATQTTSAAAAAATTTSASADTVYSSTIAAAAASATSVSASDTQTVALDAHNTLRASYDASALVWNETLATAAASWADACHYAHSGGTLLPTAYGENIAAGTGSYSTSDLIKLWSDEASELDPAAPAYSHFTQQVWKATTDIGCAVATCNDLDAFGSGSGPAQYLVCDYFPAGNVIGQFSINVEGVTCSDC